MASNGSARPVCGYELRRQRDIAVRANDLQPLRPEMLGTPRPDQERNITAGLCEPTAEIAAGRSGSDHQKAHCFLLCEHGSSDSNPVSYRPRAVCREESQSCANVPAKLRLPAPIVGGKRDSGETDSRYRKTRGDFRRRGGAIPDRNFGNLRMSHGLWTMKQRSEINYHTICAGPRSPIFFLCIVPNEKAQA